MTTTQNKYQKEFEKSYKMLNKAQREAVDTIDGPVVVVAGPGTGKTQILTLRIANIINQLGADMAENILALTFTNAGVQAMRERLAEFVGVEMAYDVNIFTFHSFAQTQIEENPEIFSRFIFARPVTEIEKIQIMEKILNENDYRTIKNFAGSFEYYAPELLKAIDDLKSEAISPKKFQKSLQSIEARILEEEGENAYLKRKSGNRQKGDLKKAVEDKIRQQEEKQEELLDVYKKYQGILQEKKLYDFSDMILAVVEEAEENEDYLLTLQEKFQYILVDEHQDTNDAQNRMVELIGEAKVNEGRPNIFTVGDEKQAIYAFQGASLENFLKIQKKYKEVKVINLENNYRSSQCILDSAHSVLAGDVALRAKNKEVSDLNQPVRVVEFGDYKEELLWLAEDIKKRLAKNVPAEEIAVFYRHNKNLAEIKNILDKQGIVYQVFSKENILDDREIRKFILYLRAVNNPYNDEVLGKLLFVDFLKLDTFDVLKILRKLAWRGRGEMKNKSILKIISSPDVLKKIEVEKSIELQGLANRLKEFKKRAENMDFLEFLEWFIAESGFLKHILSLPDSVGALRRLEKIFNEARQQVNVRSESGLEDFLNYLEILEKYNIVLELGRDNSAPGVRLMTAHGSKGLEFQEVYITNFVEGAWPSRKRGRSFVLPIKKGLGEVDDERRLFYVALTRGKCRVSISYSRQDLEGREKQPSRFLEELGEKFVRREEVKTQNLRQRVEKFFIPQKEKSLTIFDPQYIKEQFLKNPLSVSALNNYMQSPLKYFFRNLLRLPSAQTKPLIFGNIIHRSLEDFFRASAEKKEILSEKELLAYFSRALERERMPEKYFAEIQKRGEEVLRKYYNHYRDEFLTDVETESRYYTTMQLRNGETLKLYGIMDKIEKSKDGRQLRVVDYKTGRTFSEKKREEKENLERQVVFYKLLLDKYHQGKNRSEIKVTEGVLDFVEPNKKTGEFERKNIVVTEAEVKKLEEQIQDFAEDILSGRFLQREYERNEHTKEFFDLWELRR
jgi:DNA helicase-2/ATP-dependent DNA helicase PcrA